MVADRAKGVSREFLNARLKRSAAIANDFSDKYSALPRGVLLPGRDRATPVPEQVYDPSILAMNSPASNL
jgi:hypothetical protein